MNHKYVHRETRKVIYMTAEGKKFHDASPEADKYVYQGQVSAKQQAEEEQAALDKVKTQPLGSEEEEEQKANKELTGKVKREAKELGKDKVDELVKDKKTELGSEEEEEKGDQDPDADKKRKADADKLKDKK